MAQFEEGERVTIERMAQLEEGEVVNNKQMAQLEEGEVSKYPNETVSASTNVEVEFLPDLGADEGEVGDQARDEVQIITSDDDSSDDAEFAPTSKRSKTMYKCGACGIFYDNMEQLQQHMMYHHEISQSQSDEEDSMPRDADSDSNSDNDPYQCVICSKEFTSEVMLDIHYATHPGFKPFKCKKCDKAFESRGALARHQKSLSCNPGGTYDCKYCAVKYKQHHVLTKHLEKMHGLNMNKNNPVPTTKKDVECVELGSSSDSNDDDVQVTGLEKPKNVMYKCGRCSATFKSMAATKKHMLKHRKHYTCDVCEKDFPSTEQLEMHKAVKHQVNDEDYIIHPCEECGDEFYTMNELRQHTKTHRNKRIQVVRPELSFTCDKCQEEFKHYDTYKAHLAEDKCEKTPEPKLERRYICEKCGKIYNHYLAYKDHVDNLCVKRVCSICDMVVDNDATLKSHMKVHEVSKGASIKIDDEEEGDEEDDDPGEELEKVDQEMLDAAAADDENRCGCCGRQFNSQMMLDEHYRSHPDFKPYICRLCDKVFTNRAKLQFHTKHHLSVLQFQCELCSCKFTFRHHLTRHYAQAHNIDPVASHKELPTVKKRRQWPCSECKQEFSSKPYLLGHMARAHPNAAQAAANVAAAKAPPPAPPKVKQNIFSCAYCPKMFLYKGKMLRHVENDHADEMPPAAK